MRDSQFILDGLLDNTSVLQPREVMAETAADSYLIHGLFRPFSPRLADLPERRYWRLNPRGDYGADFGSGMWSLVGQASQPPRDI